jgi:DNA-binding NarL/FixJ family response regulator
MAFTQEQLVAMFSPAEYAVLRELTSGASNKTIAARLGIAPGTVKVHMKAIIHKAGPEVTNRTMAVVKLFFVTVAEEKAAAALAIELSGPLVLQRFAEI